MLEALRLLDPLAVVTVAAAFLGAVASVWSVAVTRRKGIRDADVSNSQLNLEQLKIAHTVKDTLLSQVMAENTRLLAENERLRMQRDALEEDAIAASRKE